MNISSTDAPVREHRNDIDGLRAVAVLGVVLFHIDPRLAPGGFVGVDIFFVISGYLLTSIIKREVAAGTFTYAGFYARRVKRIFPALALVVAATVVAGHFILLPHHLDELARSAVASVLFTANFFFAFFVDSGYFAEDSATKPLLHIWSLGVEEQFYFIWPLALVSLLALPLTGRAKLAIIAAVALASVGLSEWLARAAPSFAYYMLPTRAFEMLIGASVALLPLLANRTVAQIAAAGGLALIATSMALLDETSTFPGINALPSTLGAGLLILAATIHNTWVSKALSLDPVRWIGLISYSLYLWHWPVMAYIRYAYIEVTPAVGLIAFAVMIGLSWLSYKFVEVPFIRSKASTRQVFLRQLIIPVAAISTLCAALVWSEGYGLYDKPSYLSQMKAVSKEITPAHRFKYICQVDEIDEKTLADARCIINGTGAEPRMLVWGDSNATQYVGVIGEIAKLEGFSFRNAAAQSCPPLLIETGRSSKNRCTNSAALVKAALDRYDTIVLGAHWAKYIDRSDTFLQSLEATIGWLVRDKKKRVVLLAQIPHMPGLDQFCERKALKMGYLDCRSTFAFDREIADHTVTINAELSALASRQNAGFFTIDDVICPGGACSAYVDDTPVYYNSGHLSMPGSWHIGKLLVTGLRGPSTFQKSSEGTGQD